jgi:hypothetical protein
LTRLDPSMNARSERALTIPTVAITEAHPSGALY